MRVLQLGKFYPIKGGVEKVAYDLTVGLSSRGVQCDMLCASDDGSTGELSLGDGASVVRCHSLFKAAATMISPAMVRELRARCHLYDIVHVHHPDPMAALALSLSGYHGRVVLHWHSDIQRQHALLFFYRPLQSWLLRRADVVVATSPAYLESSSYLQGVRHKAVCLPIGVQPMCPNAMAVHNIRERYKGKKIIFSLGRLVPYKGFSVLVEAASLLPNDYVVLIGGSGSLRTQLQSNIDSRRLGDKVFLLGRVPDADLPAYYGASDAFCLSSVQKTEAFGIVQIEAMSCGTPVVATNIPGSGVSWVNAHGVSGLNAKAGDARSLADAIMAVTTDEAAHKRYSDGAVRRYRELFTMEKMISGCMEIYGKYGK